MLKNFFITAWRNLIRNKIFTLLNVSGLATGVVVCLLISVWLHRELSFDNFHPNGDKVFRLTNTFKSESETFSQAPSGVAFGAQLPKQLPDVTTACRVFKFEYKFKAESNKFFESNTLVVDSNFFNFFGFRLIEGKSQQVLNEPNKLVLSKKLRLNILVLLKTSS